MEEKKLTDDDMLSKVTDWLRTKAKTDGDMYYVGVIVGEFLVAKRQKEEIDILRGEIERLKEMCSKSSFKDSWKNKFFKAQEEIEAWKSKARELEQAWEISSSNEEKLRKQVDELKEERQTLVTKYNQTDEAVDYWCEKYKQAVKDTAKEIFTELYKKHTEVYNDYVFKNSNYDDLEVNAIVNFSDSLYFEITKYFKEKYGVEVE